MANIKRCENCLFCNVFLVTNEKIIPTDGDECGVYGLAKCVQVRDCKCYAPKQKYVQLSLNF